MAEILTHTAPVDARGERRIEEVMPQALEALVSIFKEGAVEASTGQIDSRIKTLPSYKVYKPVGAGILSDVLTRLVNAGEVIVTERESLDASGKPQRQKFYGRPKPQEESHVETASFPMGYSAGPLDSIPGFKQAWESVQKES